MASRSVFATDAGVIQFAKDRGCRLVVEPVGNLSSKNAMSHMRFFGTLN